MGDRENPKGAAGDSKKGQMAKMDKSHGVENAVESKELEAHIAG